MNRQEQYSLLLLAGGKSKRMGKNKAKLSYEGKTFMENLLDKSEKLGIKKKYLSGEQVIKGEICIVKDLYPERGPLGGLHACMKIMETPYCLVLPVDVPQISVEILEKLMQHHAQTEKEEQKNIPLLLEHGERVEPLIGIYPSVMADMLEAVIKEQAASVFRVLDAWGYRCCRIEVPEWQVKNINTPEAYAELLSHQESEKILCRK